MTTKPFDTLIELVRDARDSAGQRLAGARRSEQQLRTQLDQLQEYRQHYATHLQRAMKEGVELATINDYRHFLASLDEAIAGAKHELSGREVQVSEHHQVLQQEQRRLLSYNTLVTRRELELRRREERLELRQSDEMNNNAYARQRLNQGFEETTRSEGIPS